MKKLTLQQIKKWKPGQKIKLAFYNYYFKKWYTFIFKFENLEKSKNKKDTYLWKLIGKSKYSPIMMYKNTKNIKEFRYALSSDDSFIYIL